MFFFSHSVITLSRSLIHTYFYSDIFTDCLCLRRSFHGALFSSIFTRQLDPAWLLALVRIYIHILTLTFSLTAFVRVPLSKVHCLPLTSHVNLILSASIVLSGGGITPYFSTDRFFWPLSVNSTFRWILLFSVTNPLPQSTSSCIGQNDPTISLQLLTGHIFLPFLSASLQITSTAFHAWLILVFQPSMTSVNVPICSERSYPHF